MREVGNFGFGFDILVCRTMALFLISQVSSAYTLLSAPILSLSELVGLGCHNKTLQTEGQQLIFITVLQTGLHRIGISGNLPSDEGFLFGLHTIVFLLCPHMAFPLCVRT